MSSVFGLKVKPKMAIFLPFTLLPQAKIIFLAIFFFRLLLKEITSSIRPIGDPNALAVAANSRLSFGKQEPPNPGPGCKNLSPIRLSNPMLFATS